MFMESCANRVDLYKGPLARPIYIPAHGKILLNKNLELVKSRKEKFFEGRFLVSLQILLAVD